jgi:hypothetical protein
MDSYGIAALGNIQTRKFIVFSTAISALLIAAIGYLPFLENTSTNNIKQAGEYLDSIDGSRAEVFVLPQTDSSINPSIVVPMLDLFTKKNIVYLNRRDIETPQYITKLPWRWTWEVSNLLYLANQDSIVSKIVVMIKSSHSQQVPPYIEQMLKNYQLVLKFSKSSDVFKYKTLVYIYQRT